MVSAASAAGKREKKAVERLEMPAPEIKKKPKAKKTPPKKEKKSPAKKEKPEKKEKRAPSAYNLFMKDELAKVKKANPGMDHKEAFAAAAANWSKQKK